MGEQQIVLQWVTFFLFLFQRYLFWYIIWLYWPIQESEGSHCRYRSFWFLSQECSFYKTGIMLWVLRIFFEIFKSILKTYSNMVFGCFLLVVMFFFLLVCLFVFVFFKQNSSNPPGFTHGSLSFLQQPSCLQFDTRVLVLYSPVFTYHIPEGQHTFPKLRAPLWVPGITQNFITQLKLFLGQPSKGTSSKLI